MAVRVAYLMVTRMQGDRERERERETERQRDRDREREREYLKGHLTFQDTHLQ
jgi:hypothetical protein